MSITIHVSEETERRIFADAEAQGLKPAELLADLIEIAYSTDAEPEDLHTVPEIREALGEYEAMRTRGEQGIPAAAVYEDLWTALAEQRRVTK